jgi:predicted Zn-dependent protease
MKFGETVFMSDLIEATADRSLAARREEANAASEARDWPRAGALWDELRVAQPQEQHYWYKAGEAYSEAGMLDAAERILGEAVTRFPAHPWIAYRHARIARYADDPRELVRRIWKLREAAPDFWPAWIEYADALAMCGNRSSANAVRREAVKRFPNEYWPNYALAQVEAASSRDLANAIRIWSALAERFPSQPSAAAALKAASDSAEHEHIAVTPGMRSADAGGQGSAERLSRHLRRRAKGRHP